MSLLPNVRIVLALGKVAWDVYLSILRDRGVIRSRTPFVFGHNRMYRIASDIAPGQPILMGSYHPSQQNTSTGKLTEKMLVDVFRRAQKILAKAE